MSNRYYKGEPSDHFDGKRFFHPGQPSSDKSLLDVLRWRFGGKRTAWPAAVSARSGVRPPERVDGLQITALGHSSLLVQVGGINVLLDPVWAERASPLQWIGPRRRNPPAIAFDDLPPIDAVLVTHNHYDHLDAVAVRRLWHGHRPRIITPFGNDAIIRSSAPQAEVEVGDWWDSFSLTTGIRVTIVPSYHWSSRRLGDQRMALWGGFVLETPQGLIYSAGDTAYRDGIIFRQIRERFGPPAVAILPIGAYAPRWFMQMQHVDPEEAVQIALDTGAQQVLGVHWGTFQLTDEFYSDPEIHFYEASHSRLSSATRSVALHPGDVWQLHSG